VKCIIALLSFILVTSEYDIPAFSEPNMIWIHVTGRSCSSVS